MFIDQLFYELYHKQGPFYFYFFWGKPLVERVGKGYINLNLAGG